MNNLLYLIIISIVGCTPKENFNIHFNPCNQTEYKLLEEVKDKGSYVTIIDSYEFETRFNNVKVVQFLFKIERSRDTFCLFEFRKKSNEFPIAPANNSYSDFDWNFEHLDSIKLKSLKFSLISKGKIK